MPGSDQSTAFADAITGAAISTKDLRGKVVVVQSWATRCKPCVAEIPGMKALYTKHHADGLEIIGVNRDGPTQDGGLDRLKGFVSNDGIAWPQYHQGGSGEGTFSDAHGVLARPAVFVVDCDGILASADAQGKLDAFVPSLLKAGGPKVGN